MIMILHSLLVTERHDLACWCNPSIVQPVICKYCSSVIMSRVPSTVDEGVSPQTFQLH